VWFIATKVTFMSLCIFT